MHHVLVADRSAAGWSSVRVYTAADPWPSPPEDSGPPLSAEERARLFDGFNGRFRGGDVDGWLDSWHPDAVFYSLIGPLRGPRIREFFENQSDRYIEPRFKLLREHRPGGPGRILVEGEIQGRCRSNGRPFRLEALLEIRVRDGLLYRVQEAFLEVRDGCGPFWE